LAACRGPTGSRGRHRSSAIEDQLRAAVDTEHRAIPPRHGVMGLATVLGRNVLVDDTATLRTVANRRVLASMIEVGAWGGLPESSHHTPRSVAALPACRCGAAPSLRAPWRSSAYRQWSRIVWTITARAWRSVRRPRAGPRETRPKTGRALRYDGTRPQSMRCFRRHNRKGRASCRLAAAPVDKGGRAPGVSPTSSA
jgi:hypothetical protein